MMNDNKEATENDEILMKRKTAEERRANTSKAACFPQASIAEENINAPTTTCLFTSNFVQEDVSKSSNNTSDYPMKDICTKDKDEKIELKERKKNFIDKSPYRRQTSKHQTVFGSTPEMSNLCLSNEKLSNLKQNKEESIEKFTYLALEEQEDNNKKDDCKSSKSIPQKEIIECENKMNHEDLVHSVLCQKTECDNGNCFIFKQYIIHQETCMIKIEDRCSVCEYFNQIVQKHSEICKVLLHENCPVPNCDNFKIKILEKWMTLKVAHSNKMQKAFDALSHARICETESCKFGKNCRKMKSILEHVDGCKKEADCTSKKFLHSLCKNHKDICSNQNCPVDFCREKFDFNTWHYNYFESQSNSKRNEVSSALSKNLSSEKINEKIDKKVLQKQQELTTTFESKNRQIRKPYSFGDPRQLPTINKSFISYSNYMNNEFGMRNEYLRSDCFLPIEEYPYYSSFYHNPNDYLQSHINNWYQNDTTNLMTTNDIPSPKDYSLLSSNNHLLQSNMTHYMDNYIQRPYTLWPVSTENYLQNHFSPRQLQNILFSRNSRQDDLTSSDGMSNELDKYKDKSEYTQLPAKKICLDEDSSEYGPQTPDQTNSNSKDKTFNCVRRLFPTNCKNDINERDSDNESELCKKLSQTDDGQSSCSDQLSLVF